MTQITTCQICARAIKSNTGRVAHHGYTRPGQGWQTRSCFGAKYRPYEVACDALPAAIESCKRFIEQTQNALIHFLANPPAELTINEPGRSRFTVARPEGFDPATFEAVWSRSFHRCYARAYGDRVHRLKRDIASAEATIPDLQQRLAAWKAPD